MLKILIKLHGGIWKVKEKCNISKGLLQKYFIKIYTVFLDRKGSYIGYTSKCEDFPCFPHGITGIFISGDSQIGKNCVIFHQVTIGSNMLSDSKRSGSPIIGDNCYIGAGAKIIGNVKIGNNVRIGANCIVTTDIEDNSLVVLEKPKVIVKEHMDNRFYRKNNGMLEYYSNSQWINAQ